MQEKYNCEAVGRTPRSSASRAGYSLSLGANLFGFSLGFYLFFVLLDRISLGSVSEIFNLNWFLVLVSAFGIFFLVSYLFCSGKRVKAGRGLNLLLLAPFLVLTFYILLYIGNFLGQERVYLDDFCQQNKVISALTRHRVSRLRKGEQCFVRLENSLVYFSITPVPAAQHIGLEFSYHSEAPKMHLGVEEDKEIRVLNPLPTGASGWQQARLDFKLQDFQDRDKITFVLMTEGLPRGDQDFRASRDPLVVFQEIKAVFSRSAF